MSNEQYFFNAKEWNISVWDCGWKPTTGDLKVTKKKPKSELEWRDVTPCKNQGYKTDTGYLKPDIAYHDCWMRHYRLVQFKITGVDSWENFHGGVITWLLPQVSSGFSRYYICNALDVVCNREVWSAPVVVPIKFYEKLDCYVKEFNEKLNGGE